MSELDRLADVPIYQCWCMRPPASRDMTHTCRHEVLHLESRMFAVEVKDVIREEDAAFRNLMAEFQVFVDQERRLGTVEQRRQRMEEAARIRKLVESEPQIIEPW